KVSFKDPKDDDNGPGAYTYPTDPVYKPGSFDMTAFTLKAHGDKVDLDVELAAKLEDPWKTGNGFSVQMVFIFVQTRAEEPAEGSKAGAAKAGGKNKNKKKGGTQSAGDKATADKAAAGNAAGGKAEAGKAAGEETGAAGKAAGAKATAAEPEPGGTAEPAPAQADTEQAAGEKGAERKAAGAKPAAAGKAAGKQHGFTQGLPGLQVQFSPADAWDRCIILSPEPAARVRAEVEAKAAAMKDAIVIPARVKGSWHAISATIDRKALGPGDPTDWGYQVVIASSDPYPAADSLLVRKVTETESQHRFGGAGDGDCAPNVLDVLAGDGEGAPEEVAKQHEMLHYECNPDHAPKTLATLTMVRVDKDED
ncbi:MAG TPA: glucodextranase DOMON-like domain-containing protein, partial [Thermoanaerobaculia bacterium]|nr:glucodextranase DOMON-like domain-containing protein [Thermoanaerobaculia bacterium]